MLTSNQYRITTKNEILTGISTNMLQIISLHWGISMKQLEPKRRYKISQFMHISRHFYTDRWKEQYPNKQYITILQSLYFWVIILQTNKILFKSVLRTWLSITLGGKKIPKLHQKKNCHANLFSRLLTQYPFSILLPNPTP